MTGDVLSSGVSPLDEAHGLRLAGDPDGALRLALTVLDSAPRQLAAASLVAFIVAQHRESDTAGEVAAVLVDAFVRRGDLPSATLAAFIAEDCGYDGEELRADIAAAFAKGSPRLGAEVTAAPPPLPKPARVSAELARLEGDALLDRAEDALRAFLEQPDPVAEDSTVPALPLFSLLGPRALTSLLGALEIREHEQGADVIRQRTEGREAFVLVRGAVEVYRTEKEQRTTLAALGPGSIFGEMALVSNAPRAASVVALEPVQLLVASRKALEELASREAVVGEQLGWFCRRRMIENLLRHSPILQTVEPEQRPGLVRLFQTRQFDAGDALVTAGEESEGLFLIASGMVEVMGRDEDDDVIRLAQLGPGDVVGEISLVLRRPATADVVAAHATVALELTRDKFQEAIKAHPSLLSELYEIATRREQETRSVVAQEALDIEDVVLV